MIHSIEGGLDFMKELNDSLNKEPLNNQNICLISNTELNIDHVKLDCGHKFNYSNIYNEVIYQKTKLSTDTVKLSIRQIKCPYCRNIQNYLLPQIKGYAAIQGVNSPLKYCRCLYNCNYKLKSGICGKPCNEEFCVVHQNKIKANDSKKNQYIENRCKCATMKGIQCKNVGVIDVENSISKIKCKICNVHNKKLLTFNQSERTNELNNMLKYI